MASTSNGHQRPRYGYFIKIELIAAFAIDSIFPIRNIILSRVLLSFCHFLIFFTQHFYISVLQIWSSSLFWAGVMTFIFISLSPAPHELVLLSSWYVVITIYVEFVSFYVVWILAGRDDVQYKRSEFSSSWLLHASKVTSFVLIQEQVPSTKGKFGF